jgi:hypothetical protein|tara:strand:- start:2469 stop:3182 length:714 start_codon:yes stop_codon:yes gene_type:complete
MANIGMLMGSGKFTERNSGGDGGGLLAPSTNLFAQWDAALGITKDGSDFVSSWEDQINGLIINQDAGASQPLWVDSALNSLPLIRFDGANDRLAGTWTAIGASSSVYMVVHFTDASAADVAWHSKTYWGMFSGGSSGLNSFYNNGGRAFTGCSNNSWHIIGVTRRADTVNYIKVDSGSVQTLAGTASGTLTNMSIGDRDSLNSPADVDFAEILIYNASHDDSKMESVNNYLISKYAL